MDSLRRPLLLSLVAVAAVFLLMVGAFGVSRLVHRGQILGNVSTADLDLSGLDAEQATEALDLLAARLDAEPAALAIGSTTVAVSAQEVGFGLDVPAMVEQAMEMGRTGGIAEQFRSWLGSFGARRTLEPIATLDDRALGQVIGGWDADIVGDAAFEGAVEVDGVTPVPRYPKTGTGVDPEAARAIVLEQLATLTRTTPRLPLITKTPALTDADVDRAVQQARLWLSAPITLADEGRQVEVTFAVEDLASALRSAPSADADPVLELSFDPAVVERLLDDRRDQLESPPVDAHFEITDYDVTVVPGTPGTVIDPVATATALEKAAAGSTRRGVLPFEPGAQPDVTTGDLEALDIHHLVSSFTTYYDCCETRVTNIHTMADTVDGAIVLPGDTFELNTFVGERTTEKGYLPAHSIEAGEIIDTVGGGVSQFATTFYNAVFWGGYQDVDHKPHSFYFSRYPEGIEATISWPRPNLEFRNDSPAAILIKTEYTATSITVKFYGDNDGRVVIGTHKPGNTDIQVAREGGADARRVTAVKSDRFAPTTPTTEYRADDTVEPGTSKRLQSPADGWSIKVTRTIDQGGHVISQEWVVRYSAKREILAVNPCEMPDTTIPCPTTTTTTPVTTTVP